MLPDDPKKRWEQAAQAALHPQLGLQRVLSLGPNAVTHFAGTKKACVFPWPITLALEPESFMDEKLFVSMRVARLCQRHL